MRFSRIIGLVLITISVIPTYKAYYTKKRIHDKFVTTSEEVIHSTKGIEPNSTETFQSNYPYGHGLIIRNAKATESNSDITIHSDGDPFYIEYEKGNELRYGSSPNIEIQVSKNEHFEGEIEFLTATCGCENMIPSLFFYASLIPIVAIMPFGLYLTLRKL